MNFIQIKNLRSLRDTGEIEMKKINVLLGSNSSGKSTFLRIFPLLRQSFGKRINGPLLWCGDDDDYVDFGSFEEALHYHAHGKDDTIRLVFGFFADFGYYRHVANESVQKSRMSGDIKLEFAVSHSQNTMYDYVSEMTIVYKDYNLTMNLSEKNQVISASLNGDFFEAEQAEQNIFEQMYNEGIFGISLSNIEQTAKKRLMQILEFERTKKVWMDYYVSILKNVLENRKPCMLPESSEIYERLAYEKQRNPEKLLELQKWVYLYELPRFFERISRYLKTYFMGVSYIAPVRATAERYYRLRNLAADEVDCRGKNLPIFLNSLPKGMLEDFQKWTLENLGFQVFTSVSEGHVSLKIQKQGQEKAINLSDAGFGYSQILPIVTQLWYIAANAQKDRSKIPKTIVIEQPELHLHPALQAKLMDIIVKIAARENIYFIVETHSETIINRLGALIDRKKIRHDDIGIVIFNKKFGDDKTRISKSSFDDEGYLKDWPVGFFEPEEE